MKGIEVRKLLFAVCLLMAWSFAARTIPAAANAILPLTRATPAPFRTFDIQRKLLSLEQYRGGVVLIRFWTSARPVCQPELSNVVAA